MSEPTEGEPTFPQRLVLMLATARPATQAELHASVMREIGNVYTALLDQELLLQRIEQVLGLEPEGAEGPSLDDLLVIEDQVQGFRTQLDALRETAATSDGDGVLEASPRSNFSLRRE